MEKEEIRLAIELIMGMVILILLASTCEKAKELKEYQKVSHLNDLNLQKELKRVRDTLGRERVLYRIQEVALADLKQSTSNELENIKKELKALRLNPNKLHSTTIVETFTRDTVIVEVKDTIPVEAEKHDTPIAYGDKWIDLKGNVFFNKTADTWVVDSTKFSYTIKNKTSISYVFKKKLFKPQELHLVVMNENPYTTTNNVQTYVIKNKKKWHQQWWFNSLLSFGAGLTVGVLSTR